MVFTPDGQTLISATGDRAIRLWDVATGKKKGQFPIQQAKIYSLALSPDGRTLASGGGDQIVRLWEVVSLQEIQAVPGAPRRNTFGQILARRQEDGIRE